MSLEFKDVTVKATYKKLKEWNPCVGDTFVSQQKSADKRRLCVLVIDGGLDGLQGVCIASMHPTPMPVKNFQDLYRPAQLQVTEVK